MNLLSWNVAGRQRGALAAQLEKVLGQQADVVALQEITAKTYAPWVEGLVGAGYSLVSSIDLLAIPYPEPIKRKNFNLVATRGRIAPLPGLTWPDAEEARVAFPEKYVAALVECDGLQVEVHNAHLPPGSSRGIIKPQAFNAIARRLDEPTRAPQILCGDFNSPIREDDQGVTSAGQRHPGIPWWGAAELGVLEHPRLRDVYRAQHRPGTEFAVSHVTRGGNKRYDHIYADPAELHCTTCSYATEWMEQGLSDHAALQAMFARP